MGKLFKQKVLEAKTTVRALIEDSQKSEVELADKLVEIRDDINTALGVIAENAENDANDLRKRADDLTNWADGLNGEV